MDPKNLHFLWVLGWCCCCWSKSHTFKSHCVKSFNIMKRTIYQIALYFQISTWMAFFSSKIFSSQMLLEMYFIMSLIPHLVVSLEHSSEFSHFSLWGVWLLLFVIFVSLEIGFIRKCVYVILEYSLRSQQQWPATRINIIKDVTWLQLFTKDQREKERITPKPTVS